MRLCGILSAPPEARLALDLYTVTGDILLRAGTPLTPEHRRALWRRGIVCVVIEDEETQSVPVRPLVSTAVRAQAVRLLARLTAPLAEAAGRELDRRLGRSLPGLLSLGELGELLDRLLHEVLAEPLPGVMIGASQSEGWLLNHLVETTALTVLLGRSFDLTPPELRVLARGAFLHDLGMLLVPKAIRGKSAALTPGERTLVRQHPMWGWHLLRAVWPDRVREATIAWQHHERQDGAGYPQGLRGTNRWVPPESGRGGRIHPYAELVAVASVVAALQADRPYRRRYPPEVARGILRRLAGPALNREIVETLLELTAPFPLGTPVRVVAGVLRDWWGVVVGMEPQPPYRPIVRLLRNARGKRITPFEVSAADDPRLHVRTDWRLRPEEVGNGPGDPPSAAAPEPGAGGDPR